MDGKSIAKMYRSTKAGNINTLLVESRDALGQTRYDVDPTIKGKTLELNRARHFFQTVGRRRRAPKQRPRRLPRRRKDAAKHAKIVGVECMFCYWPQGKGS